jgi:16S rRNA (cytosine967-C5)-methyltransferase
LSEQRRDRAPRGAPDRGEARGAAAGEATQRGKGARPAGPSARNVAAHALARVWQEDAFASAALDAELSRAGLDPRDAALATELCYGVLRTEGALLARLAAVSDRFRAPSGLVRAHLLIGAFSIGFLDRVPPFAAVSEAVDAARRVADPKVGGFVNAVLRRLAADVEKKGRPEIADAIVATCPAWLKDAIGRAVGAPAVRAYLTEGVASPPLGLCVGAADREEVIARLRAAAPGAQIDPGAASPRAILVRGAGDLRRLPGYGADMIAQEEGAQVIALALGARPGERVLDACAGHGNKTWLLQQEVGGASGEVLAADLVAHKLNQIAAPAGGRPARRHLVDWSAGTGDVPRGLDRVLVDAPCSGTGTLRRRPEILRRRTAEDVARLAALQIAIVRNAAVCVRGGGRIVYAVCSVLREEAEDVVSALASQGAADGANLVAAPFDSAVARALFGEVTAFRLLPHVHGTDGYFAASFVVERG